MKICMCESSRRKDKKIGIEVDSIDWQDIKIPVHAHEASQSIQVRKKGTTLDKSTSRKGDKRLRVDCIIA